MHLRLSRSHEQKLDKSEEKVVSTYAGNGNFEKEGRKKGDVQVQAVDGGTRSGSEVGPWRGYHKVKSRLSQNKESTAFPVPQFIGQYH